jgi:hypothetical protein
VELDLQLFRPCSILSKEKTRPAWNPILGYEELLIDDIESILSAPFLENYFQEKTILSGISWISPCIIRLLSIMGKAVEHVKKWDYE